MGAWIEIMANTENAKFTLVAPLVGAWIEMVIYSDSIRSVGRSSRGSVD